LSADRSSTVNHLGSASAHSARYYNGTARFEKCKQLFEYQHLLLILEIKDFFGGKTLIKVIIEI
jgi:hypothetical protein